jgi:DUF1365 family protein
MTERYMRAYYHTFEPTGDDKIDAILEAVAMAGKAVSIRKLKKRHLLHMPFKQITPIYYCFQSKRWKKAPKQ